MFQLSKEEIPENFLKSQNATLNENGNKIGRHIKKLPYAFTEQGIYMLATILRGELAEQQSIFIMRAFREMRHYIKQNQQATTSIYVVDDYMNTKTLQLLPQKQQGVEVILFTENGHGRNGFLTAAVINDFVSQYPPLRIKANPDCHDRLIVLDYGLPTEQVYHCGASSKDAGKKLCAINKIENSALIHPVIDLLLLEEDKVI